MRPGSCVGPQQHFLYDHQLEWVRWAAQDELRRELASQNGLAGRALASAAAGAGSGASTSAGPSSASLVAARPITPPNEADLAAARARSTTPGRGGGDAAGVPPVTPRRPPPGQPRKTPGRSRHAVAEPETAPADSAGAGKSVAETEEERMEGVVMSSPRKARTSTTSSSSTAAAAVDVKGKGSMLGEAADGDGDGDEEEDDPLVLISPKKLDLGATTRAANAGSSPSVASTRPKTPSATGTSSRPTRIARPARPLSALADNRIVDRIGTSSTGITRASTRAATNALGMARSKAAKDLNVVLETRHATGTITAPGTAGSAGAQGRYSLRNGRTTSANGNLTTGTATAAAAPSSATKLPQPNRVLGKRDAVAIPTSSASTTPPAVTAAGDAAGDVDGLGPGFDPAAVVAAAGGGAPGAKIVGGRNVRRRRSSMGGHETVNAG